jgi:hypothetical protein
MSAGLAIEPFIFSSELAQETPNLFRSGRNAPFLLKKSVNIEKYF